MRAKMQCHSVAKDLYGNENVVLHAVYGKGGTANASWAKATPQGKVELGISNPAAHGHFVPGKEYFVDFTEAPEEG